MKRKSKARRRLEAKQAVVMEDFAEGIGELYPESMPLPGYYRKTDDRWTYLPNETDQTQEALTAAMTDDTMMTVGVRVDGVIEGGVNASPVIIVLPALADRQDSR